MRRLLLVLHVALILSALGLPLCAPIATAASSANTKFGTAIGNPQYGTDGCYNDIFMLADFSTAYNGKPVTLNSDGYPTTVGQTDTVGFVLSGGYPSGLYQFFGRGKFNISPALDDGFVPGTLDYDAATDITRVLVRITVPAPPPAVPDTEGGAPRGRFLNWRLLLQTLTIPPMIFT